MVINKPADTDGQSLKVVAISDIHLGYATNKTMLAGYVDLINAQRPDIVLIGGDLIDNSVAPCDTSIWKRNCPRSTPIRRLHGTG